MPKCFPMTSTWPSSAAANLGLSAIMEFYRQLDQGCGGSSVGNLPIDGYLSENE
jgi:hypothetical protein